MKVYDCFIFNDELDLLETRLKYLDNITDHFVLVESARTLSGNIKPLHYEANKDRFAAFHHKIIHLVAPVNDMKAWDYEFFQRNYIKKGLEQCKEDDLIFISDADEIIDIKAILSIADPQQPALIELPMNYYFLNVSTNASFFVNLVAPWSFIKDKDLGFRYKNYPTLTDNRITTKQVHTGWHFSYLYGWDIGKYQEKIRSFSHQEYHTAYFLDEKRIERCLQFGIDIFERPFMQLRIDDTGMPAILPFLPSQAKDRLIHRGSSFKKMRSFSDILFILRRKFYQKAKYRLRKLVGSQKNEAS
jgi:beta-1,4-mannosyl-glycoprotein beta-1,4-N-acetylglucosaminyltransferase